MPSFTTVVTDIDANYTWDEQACLRGCMLNNLSDQELLYKHFYKKMMSMILRYTQDRDNASTILNNGFLKVFRGIHTFKNHGSLEGWIRRIMIHAISDFFRYKNPLKEVAYEEIPAYKEVAGLHYISYDYDLLLKILHQLPPATRAVINLFIIDGYTHKEIAELLNISEGTSKWHVAEGRKILSQQLSFLRNA